MFERFREYFSVTNSGTVSFEEKKEALLVLRDEFQGMEFGNGIYRVFKTEDIAKWKEIISEAYPDFAGKFEPFGFDWLGRCFAVDLRDIRRNEILMFEIGTAEVLEIPCDIVSFHDEEIPENSDACLASTFYEQWQEYSSEEIGYSICVGYKVPLFLNGEDVIENLEISDMEVYWYLLAQIKNQ